MMQKCPKYGKNLRAFWYAWSEEGGELQEPWWPTCRSPSLLFLTKAFLSILQSLPPPGLRGCSWTPRRLQTDVLGRAEHALLDVTSSYGAVKEAEGLSALQRPRQYKSQTVGFELVCLLPSPQKALVRQDTAGSFSVYRHNICHFWLMLLFPEKAVVKCIHFKQGWVAAAGIRSLVIVLTLAPLAYRLG